MVILVSLPIAGCTLAAGIAAGLADRKRPFSLLRLTGARLATLRRVVALEGAVPLLAVAAVAIGTGFAAAAMYASEAQHHPMVAPGPRTTSSPRAGSSCPSASSRPPSRCWHASPDPRSRETNEPASPRINQSSERILASRYGSLATTPLVSAAIRRVPGRALVTRPPGDLLGLRISRTTPAARGLRCAASGALASAPGSCGCPRSSARTRRSWACAGPARHRRGPVRRR